MNSCIAKVDLFFLREVYASESSCFSISLLKCTDQLLCFHRKFCPYHLNCDGLSIYWYKSEDLFLRYGCFRTIIKVLLRFELKEDHIMMSFRSKRWDLFPLFLMKKLVRIKLLCISWKVDRWWFCDCCHWDIVDDLW